MNVVVILRSFIPGYCLFATFLKNQSMYIAHVAHFMALKLSRLHLLKWNDFRFFLKPLL